MEDISLKSHLVGRFELMPVDGKYYFVFLEVPDISGDYFVVNTWFKNYSGAGWLKFKRISPDGSSFQLVGMQNLNSSIIPDEFIFEPQKQDDKDTELPAPHSSCSGSV